MYNLTGITSKGQDYCAVWTEPTSGKAGNNIATTFVKILKNVVRDNVHITDVVCRNDSAGMTVASPKTEIRIYHIC